MQSFSSEEVRIAYLDQGDPAAPVVLLIHGFASNTETNWVATNWITTLTDAGFRAVAFDNRGHGQSEKLYDLEAYGAPLMADDARRLLDHLRVARCHVMGYSMGARIAAFLTIVDPNRIASVVFGGLGFNMVRGMAGTGPIATALEAPTLNDVNNPTARTFRAFAEQTGSDLKALAACIRSSRAPITRDALAEITCRVLVAVGERDVIGGPAAPLAELMPHAEAFTIPSRDHMKAVGDRALKQRVLEFLAET
ncbi:MAG: alpha/beta hydrolase [Alphaproteobacteria bacterium]|nr:alpha/beta hydrolase [Alphaproteobacteria bacterium]